MIEASDHRVGNVFSDAFFFHIPEYQRLYRWGREQCENLFQDIAGHLEEHQNQQITDIPEYFLGNIVLVKNPNGNNTFAVIDGQQRLTTLTILFSVLHHVETDAAMQAALAARIRTMGDAAMGIAPQPRLTVRAAMQDVFHYVQDIDDQERRNVFFDPGITTQQLLNRAPTEVEETVRNNALLLRALVAPLDDENRRRLVQFLTQRCALVVAKTDNVDAAMLIFQVMNDRGLDLSPTDVLKPEIIGNDHGGPNGLAQQWEEIEEAFGSDGFQDLFSHIRFIYGRNEIRGSLTERFRQQVLNTLPRDNRGAVFMNEILMPYADAYRRTLDPLAARNHVAGTGGMDHATEIMKTLQNLNELDFDSWKPVVMFAFGRAANLQVVPWGAFREFLRRFEAIAFSLALRRASKSERAQRFGGVIAALEGYLGADHGNLPDELNLSNEEKAETLTALQGPIYRRPNTAKAVLLLLDRQLADAGAVYDHNTISLEHVLPQTLPAGGWNGSEPDGENVIWDPAEEHWREAHDLWQHRLANLVLLARRRNIQAGNRHFVDKKNTYFFPGGAATPFVITNALQGIHAWTPEVLQQRQQLLINTICARWNIQQPENNA